MNSLVSFVVDAIPEHYYRTELLLFSLEKFGKVPRNRILVQCVERVGEEFLQFLRDNQYNYRLVQPYLDGKYCNKLQQLEDLEPYLADAEGIYLLDTDLAILAPLDMPDWNAVCAKLVDQPNPPLHVLERIFSAAGVNLPGTMEADCGSGKTLSTNFNGGFLFIPRERIATLSGEWRSRATWLYGQPNLFESAQQFIHVDQVAMSLALESLSIPVKRLSANFNLPIHLRDAPKSLNVAEPIRVLHFHRQINAFGLLQSAISHAGEIEKAIARFNSAIAKYQAFRFFDSYKRQLAGRVAQMAKNQVIAPELEALFANRLAEQPRRRLILHAGSPKTGTTSLQFFLNENREMLCSQGILYPDPQIRPQDEPKHQWLIDGLKSENTSLLSERIGMIVEELGRGAIHTIILSTEGIFNHWWTLPMSSKTFLAALPKWFEVELWVWLREPAAFMKSYYQQKLCNPRMREVPSNGIDVSVGEVLQDAWVIRHLDYLGFIRDVQALLGENSVTAIAYSGDTIAEAMKLLDVPHTQIDDDSRRNVSLGNMGINLMRVVNRYNLDWREKEQVVGLVREIDAVAASKSGPFVLDDASGAFISACFSLQASILKKDFDLDWPQVTVPDAGSLATERPAQQSLNRPRTRVRLF